MKEQGKTAREKGVDVSDFDPKEVAMGVKHEMEHTDSKKEALLIALDHLSENPHYYTALTKAGIDEAEPFWKDTNIRPNNMEEASAASEKAKQMGLVSKGFGRYGKTKDGKTVAISKGGKLVPVKGGDEPAEKPSAEPKIPQGPKSEPGMSIPKKGSRPQMSFEPSRDEKRDFEQKFMGAMDSFKATPNGAKLLQQLKGQDQASAHQLAKKVMTAKDAADLYANAEQRGLPSEATQEFYQRARDLAFMKHFGKEPQAVTKPQNKIDVPSKSPDPAKFAQMRKDRYGSKATPELPQPTDTQKFKKARDDYYAKQQPQAPQQPAKQKQATTKGLQTLDYKLGDKMGDEGWQLAGNYYRGQGGQDPEGKGKKYYDKYQAAVQKAVGDRKISQKTAEKLEDENNHMLMFALDNIGALKGTTYDGRLKDIYKKQQAPSAAPAPAPTPAPAPAKKPVTPQVPTGAAGATPLGMKPEPKIPVKKPSTAPTPKAGPKATPTGSLKRAGQAGSRPAMSGQPPDKNQKRDFEQKFMNAMGQVKPDQKSTQEVQNFKGDPHNFAQQYTNATQAAKAYAAAENTGDSRLAQELYKRTRDLAYLQHFGKTGQAKAGAAPQAPKAPSAKAPPMAPSAQSDLASKLANIDPKELAKRIKTLSPDEMKQIQGALEKIGAIPKKAEPETNPAQSQAKGDVKRVAAPGTPERQQEIGELAFDTKLHHTSPLKPETLQRLDTLGFQVTSPIASGTRGTAYNLANGRVLKATNDDTEAKTSNLLKKHPHPSFAKIGKVFKLKGAVPDKERGDQIFIEQEHLNPLPQQYRPASKGGTDEGSRLLGGIGDLALLYQAQGSPDFSDPTEVISAFQDPEKEAYFRGLMDKGDKKMNRKMFNAIIGGVKHLNNLGVQYGDVWWKNLMTDKQGNPKIIDVGYTIGKGLDKRRLRQLDDWWKNQ